MLFGRRGQITSPLSINTDNHGWSLCDKSIHSSHSNSDPTTVTADGVAVRLLALHSIRSILHRRHKMAMVLDRARTELASPRDCALLHQLVAGVLRHFFTLQADFSRFTNDKPTATVEAALLLGAVQLRHLKVADHAAIYTTVEAIKRVDSRRAGLVNAILRRVSSNPPPKRYKPYQRAEMPHWIYTKWRTAFGEEQVAAIAQAAESLPPLVVAAAGCRSTLLKLWHQAGVTAYAGEQSPQALTLPADSDVTALPGWSDGLFMVMDQSAQLAALALPASEDLCLDICSSPGGKYAILHPRMGRVVALELTAQRLPRWQQNIARLTLANASIVQADALSPPFCPAVAERIMLDAPCTASGLLRRHPDVKFLHDREGIKQASDLQKRMLTTALTLLKPQGILAYSVCSIHPEEGEEVIAEALRQEGITPYPLPDILSPYVTAAGMARILPSATCDGFFIALLQRC
ncbi:MAG: transcription antitermination factor NusB [Mariprofundales bacterium]|nr:transcription antitermination factor NusB [Mariprofundales bacterium]